MQIQIDENNKQVFIEANDLKTLEAKGLGTKQVKVSHILVDNPDKALDIYNEIIKSDDVFATFKQKATQYSSCPSKQNGGDLGWFEKGRMVKEFDDAAFSMAVGELLPAVATQFGIHLLYKEEEKLFIGLSAK